MSKKKKKVAGIIGSGNNLGARLMALMYGLTGQAPAASMSASLQRAGHKAERQAANRPRVATPKHLRKKRREESEAVSAMLARHKE